MCGRITVLRGHADEAELMMEQMLLACRAVRGSRQIRGEATR